MGAIKLHLSTAMYSCHQFAVCSILCVSQWGLPFSRHRQQCISKLLISICGLLATLYEQMGTINLQWSAAMYWKMVAINLWFICCLVLADGCYQFAVVHNIVLANGSYQFVAYCPQQCVGKLLLSICGLFTTLY